MKRLVFLAFIIVAGCSDTSDDYATAFGELEPNILEIRFGQSPEASDKQCNRTLYAGHRSTQGAHFDLILKYTAHIDGMPPLKQTRNLQLGATTESDLVAGQTLLFDEAPNRPCSEVHLVMTDLKCSLSLTGKETKCPNTTWSWLQGFKMVEIPKSKP